MTAPRELDRRQLLFDVVFAGITMTLALLATVEITGAAFLREPDWIHTLLIVAMTAPLAIRRVYPVTGFALIVGAWLLDRTFDYPGGFESVALIVAFYTVGAELPRRRSLVIGGGSATFVMLWTVIGALTLESVTGLAIGTTVVLTLTPFLLGREMRARRDQADELRRRVADVEKEREDNARQAVQQERQRIARELHDVVAHQMTVMTIQAEGAKRIAAGADPRVIDALDVITKAGQSALADMRKVVGLLRSDDACELDLSPLPGLNDLDSLVAQVESTGLPVRVDISGDTLPLSEALDLSAFRLIQESLTNAVRHGGPGASAQVAVTYGHHSLDVEVIDNGQGASTPSDGGGHGLVGMNERVAVLGGTFEAGPKPGGGFRVRASLPYDS